MPQSELSIGHLSRVTGVGVETIRYYERIGLMPPPPRTAGNYRSYGPAHHQRLSFIRRSRDLGFTVEQVRALLALADQVDHHCGQIDAIARDHLAEVERKIADLQAMQDELHDLLDHCGRSTVSDCRIVRALTANS
jgi:MerR family mercuric resistance operon transcriptional regulator